MKIRRKRIGRGNHHFIGTVIHPMSAGDITFRVDEVLINPDGQPPTHELYVGKEDEWGALGGDTILELIEDSTTSTTMNPIQFIKRIGLNENDKALLDTGLEDPSGVMTPEGERVLVQILWKEKRESIAKEIAVPLLKEQKEQQA